MFLAANKFEAFIAKRSYFFLFQSTAAFKHLSPRRLARSALRWSMVRIRSFSMTRGLLLTLALLGFSLVGHSPAAPAPTPKPKPKGAVALLYIKRVPGRTDKEQAKIRQKVRSFLIAGLDEWMLRPETEIPGLKGPFSVSERMNWREKNVHLTWLEDTGVLRITCLAGTPREQAEVVNNAVKQGIAFYEEQKTGRKRHLRMMEKTVKDLGSSNVPKDQEVVEDALKRIPGMQQQIADLSEIVVLDLAEVPPK
jgi:hypothetical protein